MVALRFACLYTASDSAVAFKATVSFLAPLSNGHKRTKALDKSAHPILRNQSLLKLRIAR